MVRIPAVAPCQGRPCPGPCENLLANHNVHVAPVARRTLPQSLDVCWACSGPHVLRTRSLPIQGSGGLSCPPLFAPGAPCPPVGLISRSSFGRPCGTCSGSSEVGCIGSAAHVTRILQCGRQTYIAGGKNSRLLVRTVSGTSTSIACSGMPQQSQKQPWSLAWRPRLRAIPTLRTAPLRPHGRQHQWSSPREQTLRLTTRSLITNGRTHLLSPLSQSPSTLQQVSAPAMGRASLRLAQGDDGGGSTLAGRLGNPTTRWNSWA